MLKRLEAGYGKRSRVVSSLLFNLRAALPSYCGCDPDMALGLVWDLGFAAPSAREYDLSPLFAARADGWCGLSLTLREEGFEAGWARVAALVDAGKPVVLAVDNYYLPYRPAYRRVHAGRMLMLRSLDQRRQRATLIDLWPPAYAVEVEYADLWRAWGSENPRGEEDNPFFSGYGINWGWLEIAAHPTAIPLSRAEILARVFANDAVALGVAAIEAYRDAIGQWDKEDINAFAEKCRQGYLRFLALGGHRMYLQRSIARAGNEDGDVLLCLLAERMDDALDRYGYARNLFAKTGQMEKRALLPRIIKAIDAVIEAERECIALAGEWLSESGAEANAPSLAMAEGGGGEA